VGPASTAMRVGQPRRHAPGRGSRACGGQRRRPILRLQHQPHATPELELDQPTTRRGFLRTALSAAGLAGAGVAGAGWNTKLHALQASIERLPMGQDPWPVVRQAFLIPDDRIYLNVGTLGPQPLAVVEAVAEYTRRVAMTYPPRTDWDALKERLGRLVNCDPAGLVFPRNTTEGMNFVANGLDLAEGD